MNEIRLSERDPIPRLLITGGSGFIGTNLVTSLLDLSCRFINIDISKPQCSAHLKFWRRVNLTNHGQLSRVFEEFQPTHVVHLGARTDLHGIGLSSYDANTVGTRHIIECSRLFQAKRVIFSSSRLVNRIGYQPQSESDWNPTTDYGMSKVLCERMVRECGDDFVWTIVRPTSIWGPWFGIPYRTFFDAVLADRYFHPKGVQIYKSFGYVGNTVAQILGILFHDEKQTHRKTLYLCDYQPIEVNSFASLISEIGGRGAITEVSPWILRLGARAGDILKSLGVAEPPLTTFRLSNLLTDMVYDASATKALLPELPYQVDAGVRMTLDWMAGDAELSESV